MKTYEETSRKPNFMALSPLIVFLCCYLLASILLGDFYKIPITVAFLVSAVYAVATTRGLSLDQRIMQFSKGAGNKNIMLMLWIFILAGAFASSAKGMGSVDATVNATLHLLPESLLLPGLFLAACFISLSIGTSVGTIVALTPVAVGIAGQTDSNLPMIVGIVVGGALFGDNLSFISDTTIVATQTLGCKMSDKFKANFKIALPAALVALTYYIYAGQQTQTPSGLTETEWVKVLPYLVVLGTAIAGINVTVVLCLGIVLTGLTGIATGTYDLYGWMSHMGNGILGMSELIIVTLLAGGMLELIRYNGGIDYIVQGLCKRVKSQRGGKLTIALLVVLSDLCTANNTIAIVTVGPIAKQLTEKYGIDKRQAASLLDTFSCFAQGLIPYGAQLLMAAGLAQIAPNSIVGYMYYPMILGVVALAAALKTAKKKS
ncbi:MAG: Na+/H+ antiporter NhaC family protein [Paludibacteraceae bacterium]|nr:Na+/H+ antiporter NhaC family protein [Paludibacteraceae bacterium]